MDEKKTSIRYLESALWSFSDSIRSKGYNPFDAHLAAFVTLLALKESEKTPDQFWKESVFRNTFCYLDRHEILEHAANFIDQILSNNELALQEFTQQVFNLNINDKGLTDFLENLVRFFDADESHQVTPPEVARLIVNLLEIHQGSILDPTSGTGSFLRACMENSNPNEISVTTIELNQRYFFISQLFNILLGFEHHTHLNGSPFHYAPELPEFDFVISNPPIYRISKDEARDRYSKALGDFKYSSDMSLNFIQLGLSKLKPEGKAAFLVNMNILSNRGEIEHMRQSWIEGRKVSAVISLPSKLLKNTGNRCAIIIFNNNPLLDKEHEVSFVKADDLFVELVKGKNTLSLDAFEIIESRLADKNQTTLSAKATIAEISNNHFSLLPETYVEKEITQIAAKVAKTWAQIGNIADIMQGTRGLKSLPDGVTPIIKGEHIRKLNEKTNVDLLEKDFSSFNKKLVKTETNDLLIQRIGESPAVYQVSSELAGYVIDETVFILRFNDQEPAVILFIKEFLNSKTGSNHIASFCHTTTVQTLSKAVLEKIEVPIPSSLLKEFIIEADYAEKALKNELSKAKELKSQVFEGLYSNQLNESCDSLIFSIKVLENALENKDKISFKVSNHYPFPLAYPYRNIYVEREWSAIYDRQMKFGEQILSFLVGVGLSILRGIYKNSLPASCHINRKLWDALSSGISPGDLQDLLHHICTELKTCNGSDAAQEFASVWFKGSGKKVSGFAEATKSHIVQKLNDHKHHRGPNGSNECKVASKDHSEILDQLVSQISYLSQWTFYVCDDLDYCSDSNKFHCTISKLIGDHPCFDTEHLQTDKPLSKNEIYFKAGDSVISLSPFISYEFNQNTNRSEVYSLDKRVNQNEYLIKSFDSGHAMIAPEQTQNRLNLWLSVNPIESQQ